MLKKSARLDLQNIIYQLPRYVNLDHSVASRDPFVRKLAQSLFQDNSELVMTLKAKGAYGEDVLSWMQVWGAKMLRMYPYDNLP